MASIDALGGRTAFWYDPAGRLAGYRDAVGVTTALAHDTGGRLVRQERAGAVTTYSRSAAGRVESGVEPGDVSWSAMFGEHGAPVAVTDALGSTLRFEYDSMGNITDVVAPDGATYRNEYDDIGRLVSVIDPAGGATHTTYDGSGHIVGYTDPAGRTASREVDVFGRTVRSIAADGGVTVFTYHPNGEVATVSGPDGRTWGTEVDRRGRVVAVVSPSGARSELSYTPAGRLAMRRSPAGRIERFEYDAAGRRAALIDAGGVRHELARDERGRLVGVAHDGGDGEHPGHLEVTWDALGMVSGYSTARASASYERDGAGRLLAVTDGGGARTEYEWDARGLLVGATDPAGGRAAFEYDGRGRLVGQTMPGARTSTWSYDAAGRLAGTTDPVGVATQISRDPSGFVTGVSRGGDGWNADLDAAGRELRRTALDGSVLGEYGYDTGGRLAETTTPSGWMSQFLWDDDDHISAIVEPAGTTSIARDADGWAIAMTQPDGVRTLIDRDPTGRILGVRHDLAGQAAMPSSPAEFDVAGRLVLGPDGTVYRYDHAGRLAEIAPPDGDTVDFEYDDDGLLASERRLGVTRRFQYDQAGRVVEIAIDGGLTTWVDYDGSGRRVSEVRSDGSELHYGGAGSTGSPRSCGSPLTVIAALWRSRPMLSDARVASVASRSTTTH